MKDNKNIEKTEDTENSRKKAAVMIFGREIPKKKAIIGTCALVIALVLIGGVCLTIAMHSQKPEKTNPSDINTNETVSEDKSESSQETSEESTAESAAPTNSDTPIDNPQASVSEKGGNSATSTNSHGSGNGGVSSEKPDGKPTGDNDGSSGSNSNSGSSSGQVHTHNWVPMSMTVHHDAEYKIVHHDAVTKDVVICNHCSATFDTVDAWSDHIQVYIKEYLATDPPFDDGTHMITVPNASYRTEPRVIEPAYDEQVLVKEAWDETVTVGYYCSICGATK